LFTQFLTTNPAIADIKPSALEYKMVPSTKVAINSLDLQMSLDVAIQATSEYPYISFVNISLSGVPEFSLRIVPQQER
jgi:Ca2+-dependent lipid-binding protein